MKLSEVQEDVLADIISLESDETKNIFGYLDENVIDRDEKLEIIDFLEENGLIRVDRLAGNPVNVETTGFGREYFSKTEEDDAEAEGQAPEKSSDSRIIFLIIGIIIGAILMFFLGKYNII